MAHAIIKITIHVRVRANQHRIVTFATTSLRSTDPHVFITRSISTTKVTDGNSIRKSSFITRSKGTHEIVIALTVNKGFTA